MAKLCDAERTVVHGVAGGKEKAGRKRRTSRPCCDPGLASPRDMYPPDMRQSPFSAICQPPTLQPRPSYLRERGPGLGPSPSSPAASCADDPVLGALLPHSCVRSRRVAPVKTLDREGGEYERPYTNHRATVLPGPRSLSFCVSFLSAFLPLF